MPPIGISLFRGLQNMQGPAGMERRMHRGIADGTEHPTRANERLGHASIDRPDGPLIWIHLLGLEEIEKILGLVQHFRAERDDLNVLVTTTRFDADQIPFKTVIHQYSPYSSPTTAAAFLDHWRPDLLLWMDAKLDVTLLPETFQRDIPAFWVNAHLPKEAQRQWRWLPGSTKSILTGFETILAENEYAARETRRLGAASDRVVMSGPLQMEVVPPSCDMAERDRLASTLAARPVWLASRICEVEVKDLMKAHRHLARRSHRLLFILEPRNPDNGDELRAELEAEGWVVANRSRDEDPTPEIQVLIADVAEESGLWMHLAPITYAGGSLGVGTDVNPLEPAALGSVVLFGPKVNGFREAYRRLESSGAATKISDAASLTSAVEQLLSPDQAAQMAMAAWDVTTSGAEVSDLLCEKVMDSLDRAGV